MATYFEYRCKGCGYTVNANPKGNDMVRNHGDGSPDLLLIHDASFKH